MKIWLRILASIGLLLATPAQADPAISWIKDNIDSQSEDGTLARFYVVGVYDGLSWANAELANRGDKLMFCQPPKKALSASEVIEIVSRFVKSWKGESDTPAGIVILFAFEAEFPCT